MAFFSLNHLDIVVYVGGGRLFVALFFEPWYRIMWNNLASEEKFCLFLYTYFSIKGPNMNN